MKGKIGGRNVEHAGGKAKKPITRAASFPTPWWEGRVLQRGGGIKRVLPSLAGASAQVLDELGQVRIDHSLIYDSCESLSVRGHSLLTQNTIASVALVNLRDKWLSRQRRTMKEGRRKIRTNHHRFDQVIWILISRLLSIELTPQILRY